MGLGVFNSSLTPLLDPTRLRQLRQATRFVYLQPRCLHAKFHYLRCMRLPHAAFHFSNRLRICCRWTSRIHHGLPFYLNYIGLHIFCHLAKKRYRIHAFYLFSTRLYTSDHLTTCSVRGRQYYLRKTFRRNESHRSI